MVQILYRFASTRVIETEDCRLDAVLTQISRIEGFDKNDVYCCQNGRLLGEKSQCNESTILCISLRLLGGKGGFGNLMKKKGKVANPNAVVDFGSCRDLNGRRMRVVNAAVAIQKWKDKLERYEELKLQNPDLQVGDVSIEAPRVGIHGWYSDVPNWAEGLKRSRGLYMKEQKKQKLCERWLKAREHGVPPGADHHWGCPRRDQCDFAHGVEELTGEGRAKYLREEALRKRKEEKEKIENYTSYDDVSGSVVAGVEEGLKQQRQQKQQKQQKESKKKSSLLFDEFGTVKKAKKAAIKEESAIPFKDRMVLLSGEALIQEDGILSGVSSFPSIRLGRISVATGSYYYEVHILTEGLVQIGWSSNQSVCSEEEENGVGDSESSWSFDTARGVLWNGNSEDDLKYAIPCHPGDIVGVFLKADENTLSYSINGQDFGTAFMNVKAVGGVFPAISLEKDEAVLINLGQIKFEYEPLVEYKSVWEFVKTVSKRL